MASITANPYALLAITGFFTGLGAAAGSAVTELWIKPRIAKLKEHVEKKMGKSTENKDVIIKLP